MVPQKGARCTGRSHKYQVLPRKKRSQQSLILTTVLINTGASQGHRSLATCLPASSLLPSPADARGLPLNNPMCIRSLFRHSPPRPPGVRSEQSDQRSPTLRRAAQHKLTTARTTVGSAPGNIIIFPRSLVTPRRSPQNAAVPRVVVTTVEVSLPPPPIQIIQIFDFCAHHSVAAIRFDSELNRRAFRSTIPTTDSRNASSLTARPSSYGDPQSSCDVEISPEVLNPAEHVEVAAPLESSAPSTSAHSAPTRLSDGSEPRNFGSRDYHRRADRISPTRPRLGRAERPRRRLRPSEKIDASADIRRFGGNGGAATSTIFRILLVFALLGGLLTAGDSTAVPPQSPSNHNQELHGYSSSPSQTQNSASGASPSQIPSSNSPLPSTTSKKSDVRWSSSVERSHSEPILQHPYLKNDTVISISNDALKPFLHFTRHAKIQRAGETREEVFHEDGSFDNVFVDDAGETTVTLICNAAPYPNKDTNKFNRDSTAIAKSIRWVREGAPFQRGKELRIENATAEDVGEYRCVADSIEIDTFMDTYPRGALLSDALFIRRMEPPRFEQHPESQIVAEGNSLRMACTATGASLPSIRWLREESPIDVGAFGGRLAIYSIRGESVLHLRNASYSDEGRYRCVAEPKDFEVRTESSQATVQIVAPSSDKATAPDRLELISPSSSVVSVNGGKAAILECLTVDTSASVFWRRAGQKTVLAKTTALVLKGFSEMSKGYECVAMPGGHVLRNVTIQAIERPVILSRTEKGPGLVVSRQGSTQRFTCNVLSKGPPGEISVRWFLNGRSLQDAARVKFLSPQLKTSPDGFWVYSRDLLLSDIQLEDEGLYQCVAQNRFGQSTFVFAVEVHSEANERIQDLTATIDHRRNKLKLRWRLPPSLDPLAVHHTTFFLSYYLTDGGKANKIQLGQGVHCSEQGACESECCSIEYYLTPHSNYTIQMSMLEGNTLSPLSDEITIITYDAAARNSADLSTLVNGNDILVAWERPSEEALQGVLQEFSFEHFSRDPKSVPRRPKITRTILPSNQTSYIIENVTRGFIYHVRVIPITRAGLPSNDQLRDHYVWTRVRVPATTRRVISRIAPPPIEVVQQNNNAIVDVNWPLPESKEIRFMKVTYSDITDNIDGPPTEITVPVEMGTTRIVDSLELDQQYEICGEFITAEGVRSFARCVHTYLTVSSRALNDVDRNVVPLAINCDNKDITCWCSSSDDKGEATRVFWSIPNGSRSDTVYVVHYALDELDRAEEPPTHETKGNFADIPDLLANTTYRVMIEARATSGKSVEGSWFDCTTPEYRKLPYPLDISYEAVNTTEVRVAWTPQLEEDDELAAVIGYTVFVYSHDSLFRTVPVEGRNTSEILIRNLPSDREYRFQLSSQTEKPRTFSEKSPLVTVALYSSPPAIPWYNVSGNRNRIIALVIMCVMVSISVCVLCVMIAHKWPCKRPKVRRLDCADDAEKNAVEMQVISMRVTPPRNPGDTVETIRLLDDDSVQKVFDEKGGDLGAQPSGRSWFEKLLEEGDPLLRGLIVARDLEFPEAEEVVIVHEAREECEPEMSTIDLEVPEEDLAVFVPAVPIPRLGRSRSCDALPLSRDAPPPRTSSKSTSLHSCGVVSARLFVVSGNGGDASGIGGGDATTSTSGTSSSPHHSPATVANFTSSLPNLNDSGIVYDDLLINHQSHHLSLIPSNPPPAASSIFFCHLQANSFTHFAANHHATNATES